MNSRSEIYGTCCHKPTFHRFCADDPTGEKVGSNNLAVTETVLQPPTVTENSNPGYFDDTNQLEFCQFITV
eukprot:13489314-Ditylum_brightwellii.AAC.1